MALTFTQAANKESEVFGSSRVLLGVATLDATSGTINTGFGQIFGFAITPQSAATGGFNVTATASSVVIASGASGDDFRVVVFGG